MSDDTWHGAGSPPMGAEHDPDWPGQPDRAPAVGDEVTHLFDIDSASRGLCRRCGGYELDQVHVNALVVACQNSLHLTLRDDAVRIVENGWRPAGYRERVAARSPVTVQERALAGEPDAVRRMRILTELDDGSPIARQEFHPIDPPADEWPTNQHWPPGADGPWSIADIGASAPPPAKRLVTFQCGACSYLFAADDDTTLCPRCETDGRLVIDEAATAVAQDPYGASVAGPSLAELREAGVLAAVGPLRARLDNVWAEIAAEVVSMVIDARAVVEAWETSETTAGSGELHLAMGRLRRRLGMDSAALLPASGPHVGLLHETVELLRAEADHLDRTGVSHSPSVEGSVRRLRDHANLIGRIVGPEPT